MKKIKIAFLGLKEIPATRGTDRVVENIIENLDKEKYDVTIYCMKGYVPLDFKLEGLKIKTFATIPIKNIDMVFYLIQCALHTLFCKYDIIHLHNIDGAFVIPIVNLKYKKRFIGTAHGRPQDRVSKWGKRTIAFFKTMEKWFLKYSLVTTSVSKPLVEAYMKDHGISSIYIPNAISLNEKVDQEGAKKFLDDNNVDEKFILFASGRIIPTKGLHDVLDAAKMIDLKEQIVILGDIDQIPKYKTKIEKQMNYVNSKYLGFINSKALLLGIISHVDIFIFPSLIEAMSMMLLEAASMKVPIICSDIPENTAVLDDNEVLFFKAGDPDDLAEKLKWAMDNPEKMKEFSERAFNKLKEEYTWDKVTEQYSDLYQEIYKR